MARITTFVKALRFRCKNAKKSLRASLKKERVRAERRDERKACRAFHMGDEDASPIRFRLNPSDVI